MVQLPQRSGEEFGAELREGIFGQEEVAERGGHHHPNTNSNSSGGSSTASRFSDFGGSRPRSYGAQGGRLWRCLLERILVLPGEYGLVEGGSDAVRGYERMVQMLSVLPFTVLKVSLCWRLGANSTVRSLRLTRLLNRTLSKASSSRSREKT